MRIDLNERDNEGRTWDILVDGELLPESAHIYVFMSVGGEREVRLNGKIVKARVYRNGVPYMDTAVELKLI